MKKLFVYLGIILVFFALGILLANFVIMPSLVQMGKEVTVPNVCNLPLETAIKELKKKELEGVVVERRFDQIIEEGKVIIQEPLPNAKVKKGRIINLSISLGPETVKIPYLAAMDVDKGESILKRLGLVIESVDSQFSDSISIGKIIKTTPEFETEVRKGDAVKLIISKGIILKMPNLVGMKLDDARNILRRMGLILGEIKEVEASGTKGNIVVQNPDPEQIVSAGDTINLMVTK
jgi:serine/threonine-protein kinase